MSYVLYLVRHGIAETTSSGGDADRRLTVEGTRKLRRAALGLKRLGVVPDAILSSPLRRAEQTATILAAVLSPDLPVEIYPLLAPGNPVGAIVDGLRAHRRRHCLMLVGHQPSLGELASQLLTGSTELVTLPFRKGSVAAIQTGSLPPRTPATLDWFVTPKQLRSMARKGR
jgi:phosphohistidine phosphatase